MPENDPGRNRSKAAANREITTKGKAGMSGVRHHPLYAALLRLRSPFRCASSVNL